MKKTWVLALVLVGAILATQLVHAGRTNIVGIDLMNAHVSQVVTLGGTDGAIVNSSALSPVGRSENQAIYYTVTGMYSGIPNVAIAVQCSVDGSTWYVPTIGNTITTITKTSTGIAPMFAPTAPYYRIVLYNASSTVSATVSVGLLAQ